MSSNPSLPYAPVQQGDIDDEPDDVDSRIGNGSLDNNRITPLELAEASSDDELYGMEAYEPLFTWQYSWFPSVFISLVCVVPTVFGWILMFEGFVGQVWACFPFALHLVLNLLYTRSLIPKENTILGNDMSRCRRCWEIFHLLSEAILFAGAYRLVANGLVGGFFTEPDDSIVLEYAHHVDRLGLLVTIGLVASVGRIFLSLVSLCVARKESATQGSNEQRRRSSVFLLVQVKPTHPEFNQRIRNACRTIINVACVASLVLLGWSLVSVLEHFVDIGGTPVPKHGCDYLDETECSLPFPSMHHLVPDMDTPTGWRVNLQGLPTLRGRRTVDPHFWNKMDGFSTMAPMLFYLDGLKEAHEAGVDQLLGAQGIANSTSATSITLLLDVARKELVHHSAEVDYLDPNGPLVLLFPAKPLRHNTHYAVVVLNAVDSSGRKLLPKSGLTQILKDSSHTHHKRYIQKLLPALKEAAPWSDSLESVTQLLFDFHTISESNQLGPARAARDATIRYVRSYAWEWKDHVRTVRVDNFDCSKPKTLLARTVHAEMDVPWFLASHGAGERHATMDYDAIRSGIANSIRPVKFVVHIPCSVRQDAMNGSLDVKAVMEFGHGLFYSRAEANDRFLQRMANDERYIITAMDWRGMSAFDLLVVANVLLSAPHRFEAIRDNLIQGYCGKFALQDFSRRYLLSSDWLHFGTEIDHSSDSSDPSFVFYGISQGGILGAGYMGLSGGVDNLIDRGVLGVPGTPFALVMSRSLDFQGYDTLMLLNFYNNRQVRLFLSIAQMAWDSVEASGVYAAPSREPSPHLLLQCGLGDPVVSTIAAEALARALDASTLPSNPREVFGIPTANPANETFPGPSVALTELYYEEELPKLPIDDTFASSNGVHYCVRKDKALIKQIKEFVNSGRVVDPCENDRCHRERAHCW